MSERLLAEAERIRVEACASLDPKERSRLGQFFTPDRAAALIADLPVLPDGSDTLTVLDPGAGSGMLMAALVERIADEQPGRSVAVTAVEVDAMVVPALQRTAELCREWGQRHGISVSVHIRCTDLIETSTGLAGEGVGSDFHLVIMNPPYAKLTTNSRERRAMASLGVDCPNLYAAFLALGVLALRPGGQLVAITPRSFANGPYFRHFRTFLLGALSIDRLHTFESRSTVFSDAGVLQENIVFVGTKGGAYRPVRITVSRGHRDVATEHVVDFADLVRPSDPHKFLRVTTNDSDTAVAERMLLLPATLDYLGLQVSTGRVVDFRARDNLREESDDGSVPLIYPGNLRGGQVKWPCSIRKPQGFAALSESDERSLMPAGSYVLVKRFSAKEERRRIVAGVWDPSRNGKTAVAFENHLNVFHCGGRGLDPDIAWGLTLWLNGSLVDQFFRTFSGHTQVNATDLRSLRFPEVDDLRALARAAASLPAQDDLDRLIEVMMKAEIAA